MDFKENIREVVTEFTNIKGIVTTIETEEERLWVKIEATAEKRPDDKIILSLVRNPGSYGYEKELFEIAFFLNGEMTSELFIGNDEGDDIAGYLSVEEVTKYINLLKKFS